jgi:uncharacterized membrane protein
MVAMTNLIVSSLFLPVTLFIIIPLLMLCCWQCYRIFMKLAFDHNVDMQRVQEEERKIYTVLGENFSS